MDTDIHPHCVLHSVEEEEHPLAVALGALAQQPLPPPSSPTTTALTPHVPALSTPTATPHGMADATIAVRCFTTAQRSAHPAGLSAGQWTTALLEHAAVVDLSIAAEGPACRAVLLSLAEAVLAAEDLSAHAFLWLAELRFDAALDAAAGSALGDAYLVTPAKGAPPRAPPVGSQDGMRACEALLARAIAAMDAAMDDGSVAEADEDEIIGDAVLDKEGPPTKRPRTATSQTMLASPLGVMLRVHWLSSLLWANADDTQAALHDLECCAAAFAGGGRQGARLRLPHLRHSGCIDAASVTHRLEGAMRCMDVLAVFLLLEGWIGDAYVYLWIHRLHWMVHLQCSVSIVTINVLMQACV